MTAPDPERAIVVVNPNSSRSVTADMDRALDPLRRPEGPAIRCVTLAEGPPGIETDAHIRAVVAPLVRLVQEMAGEALAFVDACFSPTRAWPSCDGRRSGPCSASPRAPAGKPRTRTGASASFRS